MHAALLLALACPALSLETVHGQVVDAWSLAPLEGVALLDLDGSPVAASDAEGRFTGLIPAGMPRLHIVPSATTHRTISLHLPRDAEGQLLPAPLRVELLPLRPTGPPATGAVGLPQPREQSPPAELDDQGFSLRSPAWIAVPAQLPTSIRVLRCPGTSCCTAPGDGVETLPIDEYVKGVVYGEVGVFANMSTQDGATLSEAQRQQGSAEVFKTFALSARSYALWWTLQRQADNPGYDIRDGTCEQVYSDGRNAWVDAAVAATTGEIFSDSGGSQIHKYEYASSCLRLGSLPYGTSASSPACGDTVPDSTNTVACVGSWCGHDTEDMGHQTHPCDPGGCRCLVRGICQWGAAERSFMGEGYRSIIAHYQPEIDVVGFSGPLTGRLVGYIREGDIQNSALPIAGAHVSLSTGDSVQADGSGFYEFLGVEAGQTVTVTASALGYVATSADKYLDPVETSWWRSVALQRLTGDAGVSADAAVGGDGALSGDAAAADAALADRTASADGAPRDRTASGADSSATVGETGVGSNRGGCRCAAGHDAQALSLPIMLICLAFAAQRQGRGRNRPKPGGHRG